MPSVDQVIPAAIGLAISLAMVACSLRSLTLAWLSQSWPTAQGKILNSTIHIQRSYRNGAKQSSYYYSPSVRYRYSIDGKSFEGTRVYFLDQWPKTEWHAARTIDAYETGERVQVRYHPRRRELCTLQPRCNEFLAWGLLLLGGVLSSAILIAVTNTTFG